MQYNTVYLKSQHLNFIFRFIWKRTHLIRGSSEVEIIWNIGDKVEAGTYKIRHFGHYKYIFGGIFPYEGQTKEFQVTKRKSTKNLRLRA